MAVVSTSAVQASSPVARCVSERIDVPDDRPLSEEDFVAAFAGRPILVDEAVRSGRLASFARAIAAADADRNGRVEGSEVGTLYSRLRARVGATRTRVHAGETRTVEPLAEVTRALGNLRTLAAAPTDPFQLDAVLPTGRYRGECADTESKRSARVLTPVEAARYGARPDELVVANFFHDGRYWVARIRRDAVERVVMQQVDFDAVVPAAHGQVRYSLRQDAPAILVPQDPTDTAAPVALREIILSVEATTVPEQPYDVIQGLRGRYVNSYRITSLESRYRTDIDAGRPVRQYPLNVDSATANRILESGLRDATAKRQSEVYDTITHSCLIATFRYIDQALGLRRVPWRGYGVYPVWLERYIRLRGLSAPQLPNMEREMPSLADVHRAQNVAIPADRR